jgi:hypothetical protein
MCRRLLIDDTNERELVTEDSATADARAQERARASAFLDTQIRDMQALLRERGVEVGPEALASINFSQYFSDPPANSTHDNENHREFSGMYS